MSNGGKKVSVNLTPQNTKKMLSIIASENITQNQFINMAIEGMPIICLGDRKSVAESLYYLLDLLYDREFDAVREEVTRVCQSLSLLMQQLEARKV